MNATFVLGSTLVHFLWQGAAVAGLLAIALAATGRRSASTRYTLSLSALVLMLALPVLTGIRGYSHQQTFVLSHAVPTGPVNQFLDAGRNVETMGESQAFLSRTSPAAQSRDISPALGAGWKFAQLRQASLPALPWLVLAWLLGVCLLSVRLIGGWTHSQRLTRAGTRPAAAKMLATLECLAHRMRVSQPVRIVESTIVQVPAVIGWLRPVILMPVSVLSGLPPQQLEALIAHELAHIRRHDYLVNLLQTVVEILLFYHPAVWWVSKRIREEREHCCDDLAVATAGNVRVYAEALAEMEYLRAPAPQLVAAAQGGSLLNRIQRLTGLTPATREILPRWFAGVFAATTALLIGGSAHLFGVQTLPTKQKIEDAALTTDSVVAHAEESPVQAETHWSPVSPIEVSSPAVQTSTDIRLRNSQASYADTVIVHSGDGPLDERWNWAHDRAQDEGFDTYWIGYAIAPNPNLSGWLRIKRSSTMVNRRAFTGGRGFQNNVRHYMPGVDLGSLVGDRPADHTALFFAFDSGNELTEVYVSSFGLPVALDDIPLLWLGDAEDTQSVTMVQGLFDLAESNSMKRNLIGAIGIHGDSHIAAPLLISWLESGEPWQLRAEAADWLGYHPLSSVLPILAHTARADRDRQVQSEAAESIGHLNLPAATDSLIALAQTLSDSRVRAEAVESLGERDNDQAVQALARIAGDDATLYVQQEAVESLGEMTGGRGVEAIVEIARSHPNSNVRMEAMETIGEAASAERATELLAEFARSDPSPTVQREAVESLGEVEHSRIPEILTEIVRNHPRSDVQREAVETLGETTPSGEIARLLEDIAETHARIDVQCEAVETLGELRGVEVADILARIAGTHPRWEVQEEAIETYAEVASAGESLVLLTEIIENASNTHVQREAVEAIGDLRSGEVVSVLIELAETHVDAGIRLEAVETLVETAPPNVAVNVLTGVANDDERSEVRREAVESLGEVNSEDAIEVLVDLAENHVDVTVRMEAVETLVEIASPEVSIDVLVRIANGDDRVSVRREAVETLGEIRDRRAIAQLAAIARSHPNTEVRAEAVETYGEHANPDSAVLLLKELATNDQSLRIQEEAVEALAELETDAAIDAIIDIAGTHPNRRIRVEAVEHLAESDHPRAEAAIRRLLRTP